MVPHRHPRRFTAWCILALAACTSAQQPAPQPAAPAAQTRPKDAAALFAALAKITGLEARFEEEKHVSLLAAPLRSKGRIFFLREPGAAAGHLARLVEEPEASSVRITPDELRLQNRDGTEVVDLRRSDKVRTFVTSLVQVFAGDAKALEKHYTVVYEPDAKNAAAWTLVLTPRGAPLDKMMKSLRLSGEREAVLGIEMLDANGDRTVTRIVAADPKREFDAAEKKRLFGIGGE